jgi:hypothetical protein
MTDQSPGAGFCYRQTQAFLSKNFTDLEFDRFFKHEVIIQWFKPGVKGQGIGGKG